MATDYSELIAAIAETAASTAKECDAIEPQLFHEHRQTAASIEYNKTFGPGAQWQYAPDADKRKAFEAILVDVERRIAVKLGGLEDTIAMFADSIPPVELAAAEPPSAEDCFRREHTVATIDKTAAVQIGILDELRTARLVPELAALPIPAVLARYEAALRTPFASEAASVVRLIERLVAEHRLATPADRAAAIEAAHALTKLGKLIAETRDARVPAGLKTWKQTVARARKTIRLADAGGIKPIRERKV
jgi:hypothetical protein